MFTSSADVFRTRQAVRDLLEVVHLHRNAMARIGATNAETAMLETIVQNGGLIPEEKQQSYSSLLLAAALPDEDFNGFIAATALLLADRLQAVGRDDDLHWNFEAFHDHYLLADAPVRAAVMNGFRLVHETGKTTLARDPDTTTCLTRQKQDVLVILASEELFWLEDAAKSELDADAAGRLWLTEAKPTLAFPLCVGFRYLYERPTSLALTQPEDAPLIPWD